VSFLAQFFVTTTRKDSCGSGGKDSCGSGVTDFSTSILLAPASIIQIKQSLTTGQAAYEDLGSKIYQIYEIVYKL